MSEQVAVPVVPKVAPKQTVEKKLDNEISEAFKAQLSHDGISINNPPPMGKNISHNEVVTSDKLQPRSIREQEEFEPYFDSEETIDPDGDEPTDEDLVLELLSMVGEFLDGNVSPNDFKKNVEDFANFYGFMGES